MTTERRRMRQLSATTSEWQAANPTLLDGEIGYDSTLRDFKVGPGDWNDLPYHLTGAAGFVKKSGDTMTGPLVMDGGASTLTMLQFRARASDSIHEISFRDNSGSNDNRWDIRTQHTPNGPMSFRAGGVTTATFFPAGFASFSGAAQANGLITISGEVQARTDLNPSLSMRNASGVIHGLIYLNRGGGGENEPGRITFNRYNADGSNVRIIGQFEDNIANGGTLVGSQSIVTREHGDARYSRIEQAVQNSQSVFTGDLDTLFGPNASAVYFASAIAVNGPATVNGHLFVQTHPTMSNFASQTFIENGSASRMWNRTRASGVWGPWVIASGLSQAEADARYLRLTGGTLTGGLTVAAGALTVGAGQLQAFHDSPTALALRRSNIVWTMGLLQNGSALFMTRDSVTVAQFDLAGAANPNPQTVQTREKADARYLRIDNPDPEPTYQTVLNSLIEFRGSDGNLSPLILSQFGGGTLVANRQNHGSTRLNTGASALAVGGPSQSSLTIYIQARSEADSPVFRVLAPTGNVQNLNNSYGGISDARLKENIVDANPQLADLLKLRVVNFNFIGQDTKNIGLVAQEVEPVKPGLVEEVQDTTEDAKGVAQGEPMKSIKYSVLVPMLLKAVQELAAEVEALKDKA